MDAVTKPIQRRVSVMTDGIIIAIMFMPIVFLSYGIGLHRGYKEASEIFKEVYKSFLKHQEEGESDES